MIDDDNINSSEEYENDNDDWGPPIHENIDWGDPQDDLEEVGFDERDDLERLSIVWGDH